MAKAVVATLGEPWRFGWDPADLPAYLAARGFKLERDVAIAEAARALLPAELAALRRDPGAQVLARERPEAIGLAS